MRNRVRALTFEGDVREARLERVSHMVRLPQSQLRGRAQPQRHRAQ